MFGLPKFKMVKNNRNNAGDLVELSVILHTVEVVWLPLENFQTLVDTKRQATDQFEKVDGGDPTSTWPVGRWFRFRRGLT